MRSSLQWRGRRVAVSWHCSRLALWRTPERRATAPAPCTLASCVGSPPCAPHSPPSPEGWTILQPALPQLLVQLHCVARHGGCVGTGCEGGNVTERRRLGDGWVGGRAGERVAKAEAAQLQLKNLPAHPNERQCPSAWHAPIVRAEDRPGTPLHFPPPPCVAPPPLRGPPPAWRLTAHALRINRALCHALVQPVSALLLRLRERRKQSNSGWRWSRARGHRRARLATRDRRRRRRRRCGPPTSTGCARPSPASVALERQSHLVHALDELLEGVLVLPQHHRCHLGLLFQRLHLHGVGTQCLAEGRGIARRAVLVESKGIGHCCR